MKFDENRSRRHADTCGQTDELPERHDDVHRRLSIRMRRRLRIMHLVTTLDLYLCLRYIICYPQLPTVIETQYFLRGNELSTLYSVCVNTTHKM